MSRVPAGTTSKPPPRPASVENSATSRKTPASFLEFIRQEKQSGVIQFLLGLSYISGALGAEKDIERGIGYLKLAAHQRVSDAMLLLADFYGSSSLHGGGGNPVEAAAWAKMAENNTNCFIEPGQTMRAIQKTLRLSQQISRADVAPVESRYRDLSRSCKYSGDPQTAMASLMTDAAARLPAAIGAEETAKELVELGIILRDSALNSTSSNCFVLAMALDPGTESKPIKFRER